MIYFVMPRDQEFGILDYLETWGRNAADLISVAHYEGLLSRTSLPAGTYIFTALDQLTDGGTRFVAELHRQLSASPAGLRVVNDPRAALGRFELLEALHRAGMNRHRAVRATGDFHGLRFPVFLREEFRHTGSLTPLLRDTAALESAIGGAVLRGHRRNELLVVEFFDTVDTAGNYRKYSAYIVGSVVIARAMARGSHWMLKADGVEFSEEMLLEERRFVFENLYADQLRRVFAAAGIEYGRCDFAVKDGVVEVWEINTNPSVGPSRKKVMPDPFAPMRQPIRDHFSDRFRAALVALDRPRSDALIPIAISAERSREALPIVRPARDEAAVARIARALHPMRPVFARVARLVSPLLGRAARRFGRDRDR